MRRDLSVLYLTISSMVGCGADQGLVVARPVLGIEAMNVEGWPGSPFTREEVIAGLRLVLPEPDVQAMVRDLESTAFQEGDPLFSDHTLLLFAVVSDRAARKVVQLEPRLNEPVAAIRADPSSWRRIIEAFNPFKEDRG